MGSNDNLHMFRSTVLVFERMKSIVLDPRCYLHILEAYFRLDDCERAVQLFIKFETSKLRDPNIHLAQIYGVLCESLGKSGNSV